MTSSLVGSEMCIRDSPFSRSPRVDLLGVEGRLDIFVLNTLRLLNGPCAVSYTHLTLPTICSV
eukprot:8123749-Prorocentrum_lima.AAC.1